MSTLGEGSFGAVYAAIDKTSGQRVALKVLTRAKPATLPSFKQEFRALCDVSHVNLVGLRELVEYEGTWYIAMELVEGSDLLSWIRPPPANDNGPPFDEQRLRQAFADIAQGLSALHGHGLLHCDLKPSNVRMTPAGRAVVLDYGLVIASDARQSFEEVGGTAGYMAPEQATGSQKLSRAADCYALGSCLYEALTGELPYRELTSLATLMRKTQEDPLPPRERCAWVPADLDALCMQLLARDPADRATLDDALHTLQKHLSPAPKATTSAVHEPAPFEGREKELATLEEALARTHEGELSFAVVQGDSGIGKSALLGELVRRQLERCSQTCVLAARCYQHERVPYKAFDGCIDALAKMLGKLPREACAALLPPHARLLAELFPVLRGVRALANAALADAPAEPAARRFAAFRVLGELLSRLARDRPLLLLIDDLQWADQESLLLLRSLFEEQRPPVLLVCTVRHADERSAEINEALSLLRARAGTQWIELRGLRPAETRQCIRELLGPDCSRNTVEQILYESNGHPMLMEELARYAKHHERAELRLTLDDALGARIEALDADARALLEALVVAERPRSEQLFERVCGSAGFVAALKLLLGERLARRNASFGLVPAHDSIRQAVLSRMTSERRKQLHRTLAQHLPRFAVESSEVAFHWDRADVPQRAAEAYAHAAGEAMRALAFASAAAHYSRALELARDGVAASGSAREQNTAIDRTSLVRARAHALAALGRSSEAAADFREAASRTQGEDHIRLRVLSAQHEIQAVQLARGMQTARAVLGELGVPLPNSASGAVTRLLWERARAALLGTQGRARADVKPADKLALDAVHDLALPVLWAEFLPGAALSAYHLRRSLEVGEAAHLARALANEANLRAIRGELSTCDELLARAEQLASEAGDAASVALVQLMKGSVAVFRGNQASLSDLERAEHTLVTSCPAETWLLTNTRTMLGSTLAVLGEHKKLTQLAPRWIAEGTARNDVFTAGSLFSLGFGFLEPLMRDVPDEALAELDRVMVPWRERPLGYALFGNLIARSLILSYQGGTGAWTFHQQHRAEYDKAPLLREGLPRDMFLICRVAAALAAYPSASEAEQTAIVRSVAADTKRFTRQGHGPVLSLLVRAQFEAIAGDLPQAIESARLARGTFEQRGHKHFAHSAAYLLGTLEGGTRGHQLRSAALRFFADQGWQVPWRAATLYVPYARVLEERLAEEVDDSSLFLGRFRMRAPEAPRGAPELFDARDARTGHAVTLYSLPKPTPEAAVRAKELFRMLYGLHHPNVARLEALIEHEGSLTIVMESVAGEDFVRHCRPQGVLAQDRLRRALRGLLDGLDAMHGAELAHGELRASAVRIGPDGRLLILGGDLGRPRERTHGSGSSGSAELHVLAHQALEQIESGESSPAADLYAVGVLTYLAITGRLPLDQPTREKLLDAKRRGRPVPPWALRIEVAPDLEELCLSLLERHPEQRPTAAEARARLDGALDAARSGRDRRKRMLYELEPSSGTWLLSRAAFTGRARELERVEQHFASAPHSPASLLLVEGESGVGKTCLVAEAVRQQQARTTHCWLLRSRCYANVQLGHQAFDGAVEDLARALSEWTPDEQRAVLPPQAALLAQLFPVLASVAEIGKAPKKGLPTDPMARRAAALDCFRALLGKVSAAHPLIMIIDDLQWADADSFALLRALVRDEGAPRLAIVATLRPAEQRPLAVEEALGVLRKEARVRTLALDRLNTDDARALAARLVGVQVSPEQVDAMVSEAAGHPLFLRELSSFARGQSSTATVGLSRALLTRVERLSPITRRLLQALALCARPCPVHVLERATGAEEQFDGALRELLREGLAERRGHVDLACFHDRLREVVAEHIEPALRRELCQRLGEALDADADAEPVERARLWDEAGEPARALTAYDQAGGAALAALKFDAAERLYARAVTLAEAARGDAMLPHLLTQHAHALVALARSAEAAPRFERAAHLSDGASRMQLRIWAAQHQIQAAELEAGMKNAHQVLDELGVPLPRNSASAISRILWERARISLHGYKVTARERVSPADKLALDGMLALMSPITTVDFLASQALNMHHLRRALILGEPAHAARALAQEGQVQAIQGDFSRLEELYAASRALAHGTKDPAVVAFVEFAAGVAEIFRGDVNKALPLLRTAIELLETECAGESWLLMSARGAFTGALFLRGEFQTLDRHISTWLSEAEARGDRAATLHLLGFGCGVVSKLLQDDPDGAREALTRAMDPWRNTPYGLAHFEEMIALWNIEGLRGGPGLWSWFTEHRREHDRALFYKSAQPREHLLFYRATAALHAHAYAPQGEQEALLRAAEADLRKMGKTDYGKLWQRAIASQIWALRGRTKDAIAAAREARARYVELGQLGLVQSYTLFLGMICPEEAAAREPTLDWFRAQAWKDPWQAATTWVPAARALARR